MNLQVAEEWLCKDGMGGLLMREDDSTGAESREGRGHIFDATIFWGEAMEKEVGASDEDRGGGEPRGDGIANC